MSSSYSSLDWVCLTGSISLSVDSFVFVFVFCVFILRICHTIVTRWVGPGKIEA